MGEAGDLQHIDLPGAALCYVPCLLPPEETGDLLAALMAETPWRQDSITLFGRTMLQPRLVAWVGDPGCDYSYSGLRLAPEPWTPLLNDLCERVEMASGHRFNSVLLNLYRDGADSMGLHADDEPELGRQPVIASLSLGAERPIIFRCRHDKTLSPLRLPLADGSLLIMSGDTQANWRHEIPKSRRLMGPRINLTFRRIVQRDGRSV